jgi:hypothetical protein
MDNNYWVGPYGIKVPMNIESIVAEDGRNTLSRDGSQTQMNVIKPISQIEYLRRFAIIVDGQYHWRGVPKHEVRKTKIPEPRNATRSVGPAPNGAEPKYWIGPYGIKVPVSTPVIMAKDGFNHLHQDGKETGIMVSNPISQIEYLRRHATIADGEYYWKDL